MPKTWAVAGPLHVACSHDRFQQPISDFVIALLRVSGDGLFQLKLNHIPLGSPYDSDACVGTWDGISSVSLVLVVFVSFLALPAVAVRGLAGLV